MYYALDEDHDAGKQPITNGTESAVALWLAAGKLYAADALAAASPGRQCRDGGEALRDLRGSRRMLGRLCEPLDADPEAVARAIEKIIQSGKGAGAWAPRPDKRRPAKAA